MNNRCFGCMKINQQHPQCEHCGFDENTHNEPHQLPLGTVLHGQYVIGRCLGQGGFGITYLGWDKNLQTTVAIKEYFPSGQVSRNSLYASEVTCTSNRTLFEEGKSRFLKEAQTLTKLRSLSSIVQVFGCFPENNTAYIVMEYVQGLTLLEYVRRKGGRLTPSETFAILKPLMKALYCVHQAGIIHRDISPDNIMLQKDGSIKLLDFGTARTVSHSGIATHSTQAILKHGFAPLEQYQSRGTLGPWTDEYALCATAYYCLTGKVPLESLSRLTDRDSVNWHTILGLTAQQRNALEKGMAVKLEERYPDLKPLYQALFVPASGNTAVSQAVRQPDFPKTQPLPSVDKGIGNGRKVLWLAGWTAAFGIIVVLIFLLAGKPDEQPQLSREPSEAPIQTTAIAQMTSPTETTAQATATTQATVPPETLPVTTEAPQIPITLADPLPGQFLVDDLLTALSRSTEEAEATYGHQQLELCGRITYIGDDYFTLVPIYSSDTRAVRCYYTDDAQRAALARAYIDAKMVVQCYVSEVNAPFGGYAVEVLAIGNYPENIHSGPPEAYTAFMENHGYVDNYFSGTYGLFVNPDLVYTTEFRVVAGSMDGETVYWAIFALPEIWQYYPDMGIAGLPGSGRHAYFRSTGITFEGTAMILHFAVDGPGSEFTGTFQLILDNVDGALEYYARVNIPGIMEFGDQLIPAPQI